MAMIAVTKLGFSTPPPTYNNSLVSFSNKHFCKRTYSSSSEQGIIKFNEDENRLIDALIGVQGQGQGRSTPPQQIQEVERAVQLLEDLKGVSDPVNYYIFHFDPRPLEVNVHNKATHCFPNPGVDIFSVFQEVFLQTEDPRVSNIVKFSDAVGELKVEAVASIKDGKRILFRFDRAAFAFKFLPFKVPYPVPFKLLGDEANGWLDTTYLSDSGNIRISRGNKGTTFVLQKEIEPRQELLSAIATGYGVTQAMDKVISAIQDEDEEPQLLEGVWKMIWSSQVETDSWLENAANGLMGSQIIKRDGQLRFLVDIVLGLRFSMSGTYQKIGPKKYEVKMDDAAIVGGSFGLPIEMLSKFNMELKYTDEKLRITTGYNNIAFVHLRVQSP
ncbi:hypothetical protein KSS87_008493 [Heliosperma pusillum]|nr:hypothetical protein KSS87_008493 [Heliosperma pusillum]